MSAKTFSVTIESELKEAVALLQAIDFNKTKLKYLYFQEERDQKGQRWLQGSIQFTERRTIDFVNDFFIEIGINAHVEKTRAVNTLYEYLLRKSPKVEGGIEIELGKPLGQV